MDRQLTTIRLLLVIGLALAGGLLASALPAQISPGPLSRPHAKLEGNAHCLDCHRSGRGVDPALCLSCHTTLKKRIDERAGLHARPAYRDCAHCHIEHHGVDYQLIWWGEKGRDSFNHDQTGYPLRGAHTRPACRDCHSPVHMTDVDALKREGVDVNRTFLGLSTSCASCHADPHRAQFQATTCASCHVETAWKPASRFDHSQTNFPLTGRHVKVSCQDCHHTVKSSAGAEMTHYRGTPTACASCHSDPHQGKFGTTCASCHGTSDWKRIDASRFNHNRTRFPLRGKHASVACASCHRSTDRSMAIPGFERCATCHKDQHGAQFAVQGEVRDCASCHQESGFKPSTFTVADHQATSYPLEGAHRNVACDRCHREVPVSNLIAEGVDLRFEGPRPATIQQFRFASTNCPTCHANPHQEETGQESAKTGPCVSCHTVDSWKTVTFDHSQTSFQLDGAHRRVGCAECHKPRVSTAGKRQIPFSGAPTRCGDCHRTPHEDQFTMDGRSTPCTRCHTTTDWSPSRFDHNRDATFKLEGAHRAVACLSCHPAEQRGDQVVIRYRPVPQACAGCHASGVPG